MNQKARYNEMLVIADTCQATTLQERLYSPNILMVGSSQKGENSWSKGADSFLGVTMADRFTDATLQFFEHRVAKNKNVPSMADFLASFDPNMLDSRPGWKNSLNRPLKSIPVTDFFGSTFRYKRVATPPLLPLKCTLGKVKKQNRAKQIRQEMLRPWKVPKTFSLMIIGCSVFFLYLAFRNDQQS